MGLQNPKNLLNHFEDKSLQAIQAELVVQGLEKDPTLEIPLEPSELLDKTRYQTCRRTLKKHQEDRIAVVIDSLAKTASKRGINVKFFFDDAARNANSVRLTNHVTVQQFKQVSASSYNVANVLVSSL